MCGLCGFTTRIHTQLSPTKAKIRSNIAKALLVANESRGTDSTGVYLQNGKRHVLSKNTCHASKFVREKDVIKLFAKDSHLMLGHTRLATTGAVTKENAHPFTKGSITGVHNGIISNHVELATTHKFDIKVDSEVIFELLNANNNDYVSTFSKISGSATIAWVDDHDPNSLYLVAYDNPLAVAVVPSLNTIFFTSEFVALDSILQASLGTDKYEVYDCEENVVIKIDGEGNIYKTKVTFKTSYMWSSYGTGKSAWEYDLDPQTSTTPPNKVHEDRLPDNRLKHLRKIATKNGCTICGEVPIDDCYHNIGNYNTVYCDNCVDDFEAMDLVWVDLLTGYYSTLQ